MTFKRLSVLLSLCVYPIASLLSVPANYDILGLGSAFINYILKVNEEDLTSLKYTKGSYDSIEYHSLQFLLKTNDKHLHSSSCGGSGANVIKGLAKLGQRCAVLGNVGSDDKGFFYLKSLKDLEITSLLQEGVLPTGQAICFITPDGEKTTRSYLGAAKEPIKVNEKIFHKIKLFHIEAYQLQNRQFLQEALELAQKQGAKISLDLSSIELVKRYKDDLLNIIPKYIDIVFANEAEAFELTHLPPQEACDFLGTLCEVVAITMGDKGSWIKSGKIKFYTSSINVNALDTTGAGDLFASGFLHGYLNNKPLQVCAWIGSYVASKVVQTYGVNISDDVWEEIYATLKEHKY